METTSPTEFDSFAHEYEALHAVNVTASGYSPAYFAEYKIKEVARHLTRLGLAGQEIHFLNYGCGIGNSESYLRKHLPNAFIYSVDVSSKSIEYARERHKDMPRVAFSVTDGRSIPFDRRFDVVFIANVLHHTPRDQQVRLLQMLRDALAPRGLLYVFEHNPLNPLTVHAFNTCPFDKGAVLLPPWYAARILDRAGFARRKLGFSLFFPKVLSALVPIEKYLAKVPLGAQYYVVAQNTQ